MAIIQQTRFSQPGAVASDPNIVGRLAGTIAQRGRGEQFARLMAPQTGEMPVEDRSKQIAQMAAQFPKEFEDRMRGMGLIDQQRKNEAADFALQALAVPYEKRGDLIRQRAENLRAQGRDPSDTESLVNMTAQEQADALNAIQIVAVDPSKRIGSAQGRSASLKQFAPITLVNASTGEKRIVVPTADPVSGAARLEAAQMPAGFSIAKETAEEKRQAEIFTAGQKKGQEVIGKTKAERQSDAINKGLEAADGMANLYRAKQLLDMVDTGGLDAVSVRAKQLFGVEGANEAELSNRLSKAVLSQLKATFGAAFTAQEGAKLERIEAGLGKSTEGNRRLIEQTIRIVERAAQRGIRAAESAGDKEAAQEIRDSLEFRLDEEDQTPPPAQQGKIRFLGFE